MTPDLACTPLYTPQFDQIFTRTLKPACSPQGGACHSAEGAKAGLVLEDVDTAYQQLVPGGLVTPGDASCSTLARRVAATDDRWLMPPGQPLADGVICAIVTWIDQGAPR